MRHVNSSKKRAVVSLEAELERIEYTDEQGRLLFLGPRSESVRLGLRHHMVSVALRDTQNRLYIRRRPTHMRLPGLWDLSATGHVRVGEAREDAARRALQTMLHVSSSILVPVSDENIFSGGEKLHVTLFLARPSLDFPRINPEFAAEGMFLDRDELNGLASQFQDLLTPALRWAIQNVSAL